MNALHRANGEEEPVNFTFKTRGLTATEIAAVTAVITAAVHEHAVDNSVRTPHVRSAWNLSQRPIRRPLTPGAGTWRSFSG